MEGNHTSSPCSLQGLVPAPLLTHWDLIGFSVCPPIQTPTRSLCWPWLGHGLTWCLRRLLGGLSQHHLGSPWESLRVGEDCEVAKRP